MTFVFCCSNMDWDLTSLFGPPHTSNPTPHTSHLKPHTSHLTPHTSNLTPQTSHLKPHTSNLTPHTSNLTPHTSHPTHLLPRCTQRVRFIPHRRRSQHRALSALRRQRSIFRMRGDVVASQSIWNHKRFHASCVGQRTRIVTLF